MKKIFRLPFSLHIKQLFRLLCVFLVVIFITSFNTKLDVGYAPLTMKPVQDFSWLKEFYVINRALETTHWEQNKTFGFDSMGVAIVNKNYNPVSISQYALKCYDHYKSSGDESYKAKFINQAKYLMSPVSYKIINDDCIGFPYLTTFHDLKPPWYSGLAQAEVMSVFIRYYILTKDKEVLPLIIKARNFLFLPLENNGLLNETKEGNMWIEEYPNSKQNLHVLNGFFVITACLHEYCCFFPEDKTAKDIFTQCIASIKACSKNYETAGNWLTYDLGTKSTVSNWYMKAQVLEMEQLYLITGDEYFKRQSALWSTYCYQKTIDYPGCNLNTANYSVPTLEKDGWLYAGESRTKLIERSNLQTDTAVGFVNTFRKWNTADDNVKTFFYSPLRDRETFPYLLMTFKTAITADIFQARYMKDSSSILVDYLEVKSDENEPWSKISLNHKTENKWESEYAFKKPVLIKSVKVVFKAQRKTTNQYISISDIGFFKNSKKDVFLKYAHKVSDIKKTDGGCSTVNFERKNVDEFYVFYRSSKDSNLNKVPWTGLNAIDNLSDKIQFDEGNSYAQFLTVFRIVDDKSAISKPVFSSCR